MQLMTDPNGLTFKANLDTKNSPKARDLFTAIQRGDLDKMSFMFSVKEDRWEDLKVIIPQDTSQRSERSFEVSAVTFPAYEATSIDARGKEALESARSAVETARQARSTEVETSDELQLAKAKLNFLIQTGGKNIMRLDILKKKLKRLEDKIANINKRAQESQDVNEVRSLTEQAADINAEIEETRDEIAAIEAETRANDTVKVDSVIPANAQKVNGATVASFEEQKRRRQRARIMEYRRHSWHMFSAELQSLQRFAEMRSHRRDRSGNPYDHHERGYQYRSQEIRQPLFTRFAR